MFACEDEYGSVPVAAALLGVSPNTMRAIVANVKNQIRAIIPHKQVRVNLRDVEAYRDAKAWGKAARRRQQVTFADKLSD